MSRWPVQAPLPELHCCVEAVEKLWVCYQHVPHPHALVPHEACELLAVDQVNGRNRGVRGPTRRFGEPAQGHEDRPLGSLGLSIPLKERDGLPAHGLAVGVIPLHLYGDTR